MIENRKRIKSITGVIVNSVQETRDTWTHYLYVDECSKDYKAGQFLNIDPKQFNELKETVKYLEYVKGKKELVRAYSMTSAPSEEYVAITVKPEYFDLKETLYPPLLSPFLASKYMEGRKVIFRGYTGSYYLPNDHGNITDEVLHIVAGSGIVPSFSILKDELINEKNINVFHTMIYVNKTYRDIIFNEELRKLSIKYKHRFKLINLITREDNPQQYGNNFYHGRPNYNLIFDNIKDKSKVFVFACGAAITKWQRKLAKKDGIDPSMRFLDSVKDIIKSMNIDKKRFKYEDYG